MNRRSILQPALAMLAASTMLAAPALAQEAGETTVLETLEVQAESDDILVQDGYVAQSGRIGMKTDTPLIEVPQAISAVTEKQLDDQNPRSLSEALNYTPGTRIGAYGFDPRYDAFFVRGFPATYNGLFRDGLRQFSSPNGQFRTEIYGLEGITVLKGPASALYGASSAGGLVDLMTKRPTEERLREVEAQIGVNDRYQGNFDFSGPVNDDGTLLYRLTGLMRDSDTEVEGVADDRIFIAPALTWRPSEDTKLTLLGEYMDSTTGGTAAYFNDANGITDYYGGTPGFNDFEQQQGRIGYEFEHRLNEVFTLRHNGRFAALKNDQEYTYGTGLVGGVLQKAAGRSAEEMSTFVSDNHLQAEFSTGQVEHTALIGFDYGYFTYDQEQGYSTEVPPEGETLPLAFTGGQELTTFGVYAQDELRFGRFALTLGGRYDWLDATTTAADGSDSDQNDEQFSGRAALAYITDFGLVPYVNYTTSFTPNVGTLVDGSPAAPTVGEQAEVGVKYALPGRNAVITASLFDIKQTDGVVFDASTGVNEQVQLDLRSRGFELEGIASLDNGFSVIASYAYIDMEIERGATGTEGNTLSSTPFHTVSLWGDYTVQDGPLAGLGIGAGVRYVRESFTDDFNTAKNEDRVFLDAALRYDFGVKNPNLDGVRLQVNATNLLDERKVTCSSGYCYRDAGRNVTASLRYRF